MSYVGKPEITVRAPEISEVDLPKVRKLSRKLLSLWECWGQGIFSLDWIQLPLILWSLYWGFIYQKDPQKRGPYNMSFKRIMLLTKDSFLLFSITVDCLFVHFLISLLARCGRSEFCFPSPNIIQPRIPGKCSTYQNINVASKKGVLCWVCRFCRIVPEK